MSIIIKPDVGAVDANSFASEAEVNAYFASRTPLVPAWEDADDPTALMVMATRILSVLAVSRKVLRWDSQGKPYYYTSRAWTGSIVSDTQALPWPRMGMYDRRGIAIASNVIPVELKEAQAELAGQLNIADRTLDSDVITQGITSIKAGSVALTFKESIQAQILPDMVVNLLVPSWLTDEIVSYATKQFLFEVV